MTTKLNTAVAKKLDTFAIDLAKSTDIWPAVIQYACEASANKLMTDTDRKAAGSKVIDDDAATFVNLLCIEADKKSTFGKIDISDATKTSRKSNVRSAIKLGMLEGVNGPSLLASAVAFRAKSNAPKPIIDSLTSVIAAQLKAGKNKPLDDDTIKACITASDDKAKATDLEALAATIERLSKFYTGEEGKGKPVDRADGWKDRARLVNALKANVGILVGEAEATKAKEAADAKIVEAAKAKAASKAAMAAAIKPEAVTAKAATRKVPTKRGK
jgi:hypothetical protein